MRDLFRIIEHGPINWLAYVICAEGLLQVATWPA